MKKVKNTWLHPNVALFTLLFTVLFVAKFQSNKWHQWDDSSKNFRPIVRSDGAGYFAYLPQAFIYHDPHFQFINHIQKMYPDSKMGEFGGTSEDPLFNRTNKYFPGVALCQAPFFLIAHYYPHPKYPSDGYSLPYQKAIAIGAIFFLLIGVWLSYLIVLHYDIHPWVAAASIAVFTIGSTLLYYSVNEVLTAHVYSFTLISLFFFSLLKWRQTAQNKWLFWMIIAYAWVILLRPSNGIVVLLYFSQFNTLKEAWLFLKVNLLQKWGNLLLGALLFFSVLFIQFLNVKNQTGNWGFNIYGGETFANWNHPPIWEVLFGFRKGLFIYTPLFFISVFGFWFFRKNHSPQPFIIVLFLALFTYVTASWWCWWYGGSLGMRPFVDISLFFILGLAFLLQYAKTYLRLILLPILVFLVYFQFILTIQLETNILHFSEMNRKRFFQIFLKIDDRFQWIYHLPNAPQLTAKTKNRSNWNFSTKENRFIQNSHLRPGTCTLQHMQLSILHADKTSHLQANDKGIRILSKATISDGHNRPWFIYQIKTKDTWQDHFVDNIGFRIPNLHQPAFLESDWVFDQSVFVADSFRILIHNSHGISTYENLRFDIH